MENIILKRYMSKSLVNLFSTNRSSAAYCEINNFVRENIMLNTFEDIGSDFDAVIDNNNSIHMVYQDINKNIIYASNINSEWKKYELLKARQNTTVHANNFKIFKNNRYLGLLYIIEHNNELMICSQFIDRNSTPTAIGTVNEESDDFVAFTDFSGNIYILYSENSSSGIGFRCFNWSKKEWSDFKALDIPQNAFMLSAFADEPNDVVHFCYKTDDGLTYRRAELSTDGFNRLDEKLLTRRHTALSLPPIINMIGTSLTITWGTYDRIFAVLSEDNGASWSKLREVGIAQGRDIQRIKVASPLKSINSEFYGYTVNNKLNIPMFGRYIDNEFEKENDYNNSVIGVPHPQGYEAEQLFENYLNSSEFKSGLKENYNNISQNDIDKDSENNIQNNSSNNFGNNESDNMRFSEEEQFQHFSQTQQSAQGYSGTQVRRSSGYTNSEIERIKRELTKELVDNRTNSDVSIVSSKISPVKDKAVVKSIAVSKAVNTTNGNLSKSNTETSTRQSKRLKNVELSEFKDSLVQISSELSQLNSNIGELLDIQKSADSQLSEVLKHSEKMKNSKIPLNRTIRNRKKAILGKMHIKN